MVHGSCFRVYDLWALRVSGFEFRVSSFVFRVSGFGFRVSCFVFRASGFGFRVDGVVQGIVLRVEGRPRTARAGGPRRARWWGGASPSRQAQINGFSFRFQGENRRNPYVFSMESSKQKSTIWSVRAGWLGEYRGRLEQEGPIGRDGGEGSQERAAPGLLRHREGHLLSGFGFRDSGFGIRVSCFVFRVGVWGLGFGVWGFGLTACTSFPGMPAGKVDVRLYGKWNSNSHGARPVH